MAHDLISVIIPVYNAEAYLRRAVDAILVQTGVELEIILVDDGSTDDSAAVCDAYAASSSRITVIHRENRGPSAARNLGLEAATGEFVFFMDSDDTLEPESLRILRDALKADNSDWAVGDFKIIQNGVNLREGNYFFPKDRVFDRGHILAAVKDYLRAPRGASEFTNVWGKLFKMSVIRQNALCFNENLKTWEDVVFNFSCLRFYDSMTYVHRQLYEYHVHPGAASCGTAVFEHPQGFNDVLREVSGFLRDYRMMEGEIERRCQHAAVYFAVKTLLVCFILHAKGKRKDIGRKQLLALIRGMLANEYVRAGLPHYKPSATESKILPKLMKYNLVHPIYAVCRYKAGRILSMEAKR